jgi:hypothetical protein
MSTLATITQWFTRHRERLAILGVGVLADRAISYSFDLILYPYIIWRYGLLFGGLVMALVSLIVCLLCIWFYDWSKKDWLGIETLKGIKEYNGSNRWGRLIAWSLRCSDPAACVVLSVTFDPFITMAYLRKGSYNGMSRRDWRIFLGSWLIGNAYWTMACWLGVSVMEWAWNAVKGVVS